jgi:hypothetical protein
VTTGETEGRIAEANHWGRGSAAKDRAANRHQQSVQRPAARRGGKAAAHAGAAANESLPLGAGGTSSWSRSATGHSAATAAGQLPAEQRSGRGAGQPTRWQADPAGSGSNGPLLGSCIRTLGQAYAQAQPDPYSRGAMPHEPAAAPAGRPEHRQATGQPSEEEQV